MTAYYNEIDPYAAAWLRNLVAAGRIAPGDVDERSIRDVSPDDLKTYTQCHFFAGIGVWSAALRLAGWADDRSVWTGSCPCQPFSVAGNGAGFADDRHLWPEMFRLIAERRPPVVFGEQVASKDGLAWLDLVHTDLEGADYAAAAVDLCAAGVGAPHIRQRLYWVADAACTKQQGVWTESRRESDGFTDDGAAIRLADTAGERHDGRGSGEASAEPRQIERPERLRDASGLGHALDEPRERGAGGVLGAEAQEHGARVAVDGHLSDGPEHASEGMGGLGHANSAGQQARDCEPFGDDARPKQSAHTSSHSRLGNANGEGLAQRVGIARVPSDSPGGNEGQAAERAGIHAADGGHASPTNGQWRDADWLFCRDGKWRPVEPSTFPLAHGATSRVGRLRAYGNAIVPQVAAEVIGSWMDFNRRGQ